MKRKTLYSLLTSHKKNIFFGIIGLTMVDMMQLLVPILVGKVIDILASSKTDNFFLSDLNKYAFYLIICGVVMAIFRFAKINKKMSEEFIREVDEDLKEEKRMKLWKKLLKMSEQYTSRIFELF